MLETLREHGSDTLVYFLRKYGICTIDSYLTEGNPCQTDYHRYTAHAQAW